MKNYILYILLCWFVLFPINAQEVSSVVDCTTNSNSFLINFTLPSYNIIDSTLIDDLGISKTYSYVNIGSDFGQIEDVGYPCLPQYSIMLHIPNDATSFNVDISNKQVMRLYLDKDILPTQESFENENNKPITMNNNYYDSDGSLYAFDYRLFTVNKYIGASGAVLIINPFKYNPNANYIDVMNSCNITITYGGSSAVNLENTTLSSNTVRSTQIQKTFINYNSILNSNLALPQRGRYLIITDPSYESTITYFANYKRNIGYDVRVINTNITGTTPSNIKAYLQTAYNDELTRPDFVLLVGDVNQIPPSSGECDNGNNPLTDNGYSWLDGANDFCPDIYLGRFPVNNQAELRNIIHKSIYMEMNLHNIAFKAVLFSGGGNGDSQFANTNRWVVDHIMSPLNIPYETYYGNLGATGQDYINALNGSSTLFIYRGHGGNYSNSHGGYIPNPYNISGTYVKNFLNNAVFPFGFAFACSLNNYGYPGLSFGEASTTSSNGSVTFFGSTTVSLRSSNNKSEKEIFKQMKILGNVPISSLINSGMNAYYWKFLGLETSMKQNQIKKYILFGDPSLYLYGIGDQENYFFNFNEIFHNQEHIEYVAQNNIRTCNIGTNSFICQSGSQISLQAGHSIALLPGFVASYGSQFVASIHESMPSLSNILSIYENKSAIQKSCRTMSTGKIIVYPNPTFNDVLITSEGDLQNVELYTINGQKLLQTQENTLQMGSFPQGIYLLKIYTTNGVTQEKIIKQ